MDSALSDQPLERTKSTFTFANSASEDILTFGLLPGKDIFINSSGSTGPLTLNHREGRYIHLLMHAAEPEA
jgi:hypothetical protein